MPRVEHHAGHPPRSAGHCRYSFWERRGSGLFRFNLCGPHHINPSRLACVTCRLCVAQWVRLQKFEVPGRAHHGLALRLRVHPPTTQSCAATTGCVVASSKICLIFDSSRIQRGWTVGGRLRLTALGLSRHLSSPFPFLPNRQSFLMYIVAQFM